MNVANKMHLAELLEDEMAERGWSRDLLAWKMNPAATEHEWGVTRLTLDFLFELRCANMLLGKPTADQLSRALNIDSQFFINFHEQWRAENLPCKEGCCNHLSPSLCGERIHARSTRNRR